MLKKVRRITAALVLAGITLLFMDVNGFATAGLALLPKIQLVPAILAGSLATVAAIAVGTLLFGRVYCSVLCPLGLMQDVISRLGKKRRFRFTENRVWLRVGVFALFVIALVMGIPILFGLLDPYSAFGRIATDMAAPVWALGSNGLAALSGAMGNYLVAPTPIWVKGEAATLAALVTFMLVGFFALKGGRTWCNTVCPVGAGLGFLAGYSLLKLRFIQDKCVNCGLCAENCKASCIDSENAIIDASRCVACFNCLDICRKKAIVYTLSSAVTTNRVPERPNLARRGMLGAAIGFTALPLAAAAVRDQKIEAPARQSRVLREVPVVPPGAWSLHRYKERCTSCQACVSSCPNNVLSSYDRGDGMLQPSLSFERGYCRVNCVECSKICPTSAIRAITVAEKSSIQIGRAVVDNKRCIVNTKNVDCTVCTRNCPPGVIGTVHAPDGAKWVVVNSETCTGCGSCEYFCPVRPQAAVRVEGNLEHRRI